MKYSEYEIQKHLIEVTKNDYNNQMYFYNHIRSEITDVKEFTKRVNNIISIYNKLCDKANSYSGRVASSKFIKLDTFKFEPLPVISENITDEEVKKIEESVYAKYI